MNDIMEVDGKIVERILTPEEVDEIVLDIQSQHAKEIECLNKSKLEKDHEMANSDREDAYLANLIKIRQAKRLTKDQFMKYEVDKWTCCPYNALVIPDWESY